jgi:hypothetical protein
MTNQAKATPLADDDLRQNWHRFCDCDPFPGIDDFQERMEAAGLIETAAVEEDDLDGAFAAELGMERGGLKWVLTDRGYAALANWGQTPGIGGDEDRERDNSAQLSSDLTDKPSIQLKEALELIDLAHSALIPFARAAEASPDPSSNHSALIDEDREFPIVAHDYHRAKEIADVLEHAISSGVTPSEEYEYSSSYWRQEYKGVEAAFMSAKSEYSEIALAMGFSGDSWFGDPLASHVEIVARAKDLHENLSVGWLFDNEDVGREFSENHPVESGEVPDATNVVPANAVKLLAEVKNAWKLLEELRQTRNKLGALVWNLGRGHDDFMNVQGFSD